MKLKHYYKRYASQVTTSAQDIQDLTMKALVSKIANCLGVNYPPRKPLGAGMTMLDLTKSLMDQPEPIKYIPYIMQNLSAASNDYLKFFFLDSLTNQKYIDLLINMVCTCYKKGIQFVFSFNNANFTSGGPQPTLYVEYQTYNATEFRISSIVYHCPFNGDMETEDFHSILLDSLYILNPEKCFDYLTQKLAAGVSSIGYSQGKEIGLVAVYGGAVSPTLPYKGMAVNYREGKVMENFGIFTQTVFKLTDNTKANYTSGSATNADVSQLLGLLNL